MNLDAGTAGDTINITGTASGVATTVNAGAGNDNITVGNAGVLDGVLGTLTIHGQAHTTADTLHFDDSAQASAQTYTLNAASFTRSGLATINFDTVETVNLDAGTAGDTINITGTASGVTTTVNAGAGNDNITVGNAGVLDGVLGTLTIHGQAHTTADTLHFDDSAQATPDLHAQRRQFHRHGAGHDQLRHRRDGEPRCRHGRRHDRHHRHGQRRDDHGQRRRRRRPDHRGMLGVLDGILGTLTIHGQAHTTADTLHFDDSAQAMPKPTRSMPPASPARAWPRLTSTPSRR